MPHTTSSFGFSPFFFFFKLLQVSDECKAKQARTKHSIRTHTASDFVLGCSFYLFIIISLLIFECYVVNCCHARAHTDALAAVHLASTADEPARLRGERRNAQQRR